MQTDFQDASLMAKKESSASPRPVKLVIKKPVDIAKVDAEADSDGSMERSSKDVEIQFRELTQTPSILDDDSPTVNKELSRSARALNKSRKRALHEAVIDLEDDNDESIGGTSNQLVLYNPSFINTTHDVHPVYHRENYSSTLKNLMALNPSSRVLPSVGAFTVQCANCFKWRLIPTKEKYEEIREYILQRPFVCEQAREWRSDITCDEPADITQDGSRLWAIDKPNIAQPPSGWERQLRIRGEGSSKFADVYYASPSGKKLRSMVEVQKYLLEHPGYIEQGVKLSQFSFQIPRPLQENYVRKRPARMPNAPEGGFGLPRPLEPEEVNPLAWIEPIDEELQNPSGHGASVRYPPFEPPSTPPSEKKKGTNTKIYIKNSSSSSSRSSPVEPTKEHL